MNKSCRAIYVFSALAIFLSCPQIAGAYKIEKLENVPVSGDFVLNQTKTEVKLDPGKSVVRAISLVNRAGKDLTISVSVEDFSAPANSGQNIDLLGSQPGMYSLKDFIKPEISDFILHHGETITLPVTISIPESAQPGGLYGAVIFAARLSETGTSSASNIQAVSRLASLFFIRVIGQAEESGELKDFASSKLLYFGGPADFEFNYKNSGNVYLNPYGELKIADILGREVKSQWIEPYFVMPGAVRQQKIAIDSPAFPGIYQATLKLNRGYDNRLDQKSVYFFVLPIWQTIIILAVFAIIIWLIWRVKKYLNKIKVK